ncbi:D-lyxose/D-mannose family sugar isomerase [Vibrio sp. SA48]|uniref:D-lyxose/D-mannose family sugar isomerase n=1 Tax=Vibrio sp. S12_S33 TaxID=2720223 RepID=UPI00177E9994|nr:D-lyxose/D-mannose family sugar isomerase [Vibrio sp. S12_S33]MBD1566502.1 D-lyxose/D-mannose family sugar isomerase [Vibrio sp. S12_S33]
MKRSEINQAIKNAEALCEKYHVSLPEFAHWSPAQWERKKRQEVAELVDLHLGWDVTDLGRGDFDNIGLLLFTLRNGSPNGHPYSKPYAEKIMMTKVGQVTPMHYHWYKMEDIINKAGGTLVVQVFNGNADRTRSLDDVTVIVDGVPRQVKAGDLIYMQPGQSISIPPYLYHSFWAEGEDVLLGEVSMVNDDNQDNCFFEEEGRFSEIEEDESPYRVLCNEYQQYFYHQEEQ